MTTTITQISALNAPKISKKFGKDMTFGGRPNPTPEMLIVEDGTKYDYYHYYL